MGYSHIQPIFVCRIFSIYKFICTSIYFRMQCDVQRCLKHGQALYSENKKPKKNLLLLFAIVAGYLVEKRENIDAPCQSLYIRQSWFMLVSLCCWCKLQLYDIRNCHSCSVRIWGLSCCIDWGQGRAWRMQRWSCENRLDLIVVMMWLGFVQLLQVSCWMLNLLPAPPVMLFFFGQHIIPRWRLGSWRRLWIMFWKCMLWSAVFLTATEMSSRLGIAPYPAVCAGLEISR